MAAPKKKGLSLYEDLLSKETIAEMQARDAAKQAEEAKKKKDAALMFKPTNLGGKKPNQPKAKSKPNFSAMHKFSSTAAESVSTPAAAAPRAEDSSPPSHALQQPGAQPRLVQKRGFSDWLANEDEEDFLYDRSRQERDGRRNKKKKKKQQQQQEQTWSWDDIYDPTLPVPFLEYPRSDARYDLNEEWKQRLYEAHKWERRRQGKEINRDSSEGDSYRPQLGRQFAPPTQMQFGPPGSFDSPTASRPRSPAPYSDYGSGRDHDDGARASIAPPPPAADINMEETAEEAYARRMALSGMASSPAPPAIVAPPPPPPPPPLPVTTQVIAPPTVTAAPKPAPVDEEKKAKIAAQIAAMKAKLGKPAPVPAPQTPNQENLQEAVPTSQSSVILHKPADEENTIPPPPPPAETAPGVIVAAPTFNPEYYDQKRLAEQSQTTDVAETAEATPEERTSRPGQTGFAERLMKKLGWEKGQGLGASGEGITTALQMKAEKRKKKSDYEGGGFVTPVNMGKIVGGKKAKVAGSKAGDEGAASELENMSEVVKLKGMLENMDVDHEIAENNLMQEIGDEMGEQYGKVERLFIWRKAQGGDDDVFVKFTSPLSAVRCLKGMDGVEFAGNQVTAGFWDADMFERGEYDKSG